MINEYTERPSIPVASEQLYITSVLYTNQPTSPFNSYLYNNHFGLHSLFKITKITIRIAPFTTQSLSIMKC